MCFDKETEVLTQKGWKFFADLNHDEVVATLNKKGEIEYRQISRKIESWTNKLYSYNGKSLNFSVTENHRFLVNKRYRRQRTRKDVFKKEILTAKQLHDSGTGNRYYIPRVGVWQGHKIEFFVLPKHETSWRCGHNKTCIRKLIKPEKKIPVDDWLYFFGIYLADGCTRGKTTRGNPNVVAVDQAKSNKKNVEKIRRCFKKLGFRFKEVNYLSSSYKKEMISWQIYDVQLAKYLSRFGKSRVKFIPRWIFNLSKTHLKNLFDGLMIGDGHIHRYGMRYDTTSKKLADDFQELVFKLGKFGNIRKGRRTYSVTISNKKESMIIQDNFEIKKTDEITYCVEVPNHTIYVRRRGQPFWSRNSQYWYHKAPVPYRQFVSLETMRANLVFNLENCVYEMGRMTEEQQRAFVASIINQDYTYRYDLKKENDGKLDELPWIVYVFEEADIYFSSRSFMKNDPISPVLKKFVSVGRNFKLSGFLVATAEMGEVATKLRRRSRKIYGRIESTGDLAKIKRRDKESWAIVKNMPKYHFIYFAGTGTPPFRIRDEVKTIPIDVVRPQEEGETEVRVMKPLPLIVQLLLGFGMSLLAFLVALRLSK